MEPIEKKLTVNASVERVWKALTEPAELEKWMQMQTTFSAEVGKEFTFKAESSEEWDGIFSCRIKELVENRRLVYTWNTAFINAETLVEIELKANGSQTELTLIHSGWEKLAANQEQTKNSHSEGWVSSMAHGPDRSKKRT